MSRSLHGLGIVLMVGLVNCSPSPHLGTAPESPAIAQEFLGQNLPVSATVQMNHHVIQLEVARTPEQQSLGLMFRPELPDNRGMLFPFDPPRPVQFWMKNVPVGLDMVFLYQGRVKAIASAPPCKTEPCPTYGPATPIDSVIELRAGRTAELGLQVGDRVTLRFLSTSSPVLP